MVWAKGSSKVHQEFTFFATSINNMVPVVGKGSMKVRLVTAATPAAVFGGGDDVADGGNLQGSKGNYDARRRAVWTTGLAQDAVCWAGWHLIAPDDGERFQNAKPTKTAPSGSDGVDSKGR